MDKIILGPCALEDLTSSLKILEDILPIVKTKDFYFKASFDKANRTSINSSRGLGIKDSVYIFKQLKELYPNLKITTDVHTLDQITYLKSENVIDLVQVPAFLCRQTDLITACASSFDKVNVKKGQWLSPSKVKHISHKIKDTNPDAEVWITERGTTFGYNKLLVDFSAVDTLKSYADQVILDCTHSTQYTNDKDFTGGDRELAKKYVQVAKIFGYDGMFAEVHPDPKNAISDKESQIELSWIKENLSLYL